MRAPPPTIALALLLTLTLGGCVTTGSAPTFADNQSDTPAPTVEELLAEGDRAALAGQHEQAAVSYVKALVIEPENAGALYRVGRSHLEMRELNVAEQAFRNALAADPEHAEAMEGLGMVLLARRDTETAKAWLEAALERNPTRWQAHNSLGIIADLQQEPDAAYDHYVQALSLNPRAVPVIVNIGYMHYLAGRWDDAADYFDEALQLDPQHRKAWSNLALVQIRRGLMDDALSAFEQIMEPPQALNAVGHTCMVLGRFDCADQYLQRATVASPTYFEEAHANLRRLQRLKRRSAGTDGRPVTSP